MKFWFRFSFSFLFLLTCPGFLAHSQVSLSENHDTLPVLEAIEELERIHSVSVMYTPAWFANDSTSVKSLSVPLLKDALNAVLSNTSYEAIVFYGRYIILPREDQPSISAKDINNRQVVGNPAEFGRYSRARISGTISDGQNNETLIGVLVYVEKLGQGATTNESGYFSLDLPVGEHTLSVSYVGYEPYHTTINLVSPGTLDIQLMEESRLLDLVTITARRLDANISQTQMSIIRMDAKALYQLPTSLGERDIIKSLTLLPGVQTVGEFGTGFHVRGGSADQNLILVEGVPLFNSSHLFGLTSMINPDLVTDVTLIKAGIPARFGERSSSVMDIRMGVEDPDKFALHGGIGMLNSRLSLQTPLPLNNGYVLLGGRSSYSDLMFSRMPDEDLMNSSADFYDVSGLVFLPVSQQHSITLFGYLSQDGFSFADNTDYAYGSRLGSVRWNGIFSNRLLSSLSLGHSDYTYEVTGSSALNPNNTYNLASKINYNSLKWNMSWFRRQGQTFDGGLNLVRYAMDPGILSPFGANSTVAAFNIDPEKALELAAYINGDLAITHRLSAEIGLRYTRYYRLGPGFSRLYENGLPKTVFNLADSIPYGNNEVMAFHHGLEPRFSLRYQANQTTSLKMSLSRINQYINLVSNTSVPTPADVWYLANEHHAPMISDQVALGMFRNFRNNLIETSVELYYKRLQNILEPKNNATILLNPMLESALVSASGYSYGAEFYLKKSAGKVNGWISYTFSQSHRRTHAVHTEEQINANAYFPADFDKPHNLVLNSNVQLSKRWRIGGTFSYSTGRPITLPELSYAHNGRLLTYFSERNKYRLPDYHRLDLSISYDGSVRRNRHWKSFWTLSLMNVYGRKNIYSTFFEKTDPAPSNNYQFYTQYKLYIIGRPLPTLTYNFTF